MRKGVLLIVVLYALLLALPASCFAWTHGQFTATTDACAGCHVAHVAQAPKLLKTGPTQAHFCFMCHGDGAISAPYDVKNGYTQATGSAVYASTAGGFVRQFVDADSDGVIDAGELRPVTSRHNVWGFVYGDESGAVQDTTNIYYWIPGGSSQFTGSGFVCSSCHDPHAGGRTPDASGYIAGDASNANPRLLRRSITVQSAAYTDLYVSFRVATVGTFAYSATASGVYRVVEYKSGSTRWCGACHNKFRTSNNDLNPGAGHANYYFGMWRHPMDAHPLPPPGFNGSVQTGTPLEKPGSVYHVACFTCHRAHSTVATMTGWALTWPRDAADPATSKALGDTSALLRMDNRGVCYNCHGAGQYNCWNDTRLVLASDGVSYIPMDCSRCHPSSTHFTGGGYHCSVCHAGW